MYDYHECIKEDIMEYLEDNYVGEDIPDFDSLYEELWIAILKDF